MLNVRADNIIQTTMGQHYQVPMKVDPVPCDNQDSGVPSDHCVPVAYPLSIVTLGTGREDEARTAQPLPQSGIEAMASIMAEEDWARVGEQENVPKQVKVM